MPSNYTAIRAENELRYGTDIARIGQMLLADRYDDRTHFIFELLQNAEDALARRADSTASRRAVKIQLNSQLLQLSHYGKPFDDPDVRGICGIAESSKDRTAIGRFGIGFKSVYAYTARPEVHSGDEDFAIESFVWPSAVPSIKRGSDETVIVLPLNSAAARVEIAAGLQRLGPGALLFLREIEDIEWHVEGGPSGVYLRSQPEILGEGIRQVTVIGQEVGNDEVEESWLIFSREARADDGVAVGQVEVAFSITSGEDGVGFSVQPVANSQLVVFFPTVVPTNLGFLVQGPYCTTPSRDNVPRSDPWNIQLVRETASLVEDALVWLRDNSHLDISTLRCLPLDRSKFQDGNMFAPLFEVVRAKLMTTPLLPTSAGGHVPASAAKLARTQDLRQLFSPLQLAELFGIEEELSWLSGDISQDRTPEIRRYVIQELDVSEVTPEMALARLDKSFLEAQTDEWILRLYEFLHGQPALVRGGRISGIPIIRLTDGTHVNPRTNGQQNAFLPSAVQTQFPTVRKTVCDSEEARRFLESLSLTAPDPVDDVIWHVLPKYLEEDVNVDDDGYRNDIHRILDAFKTDSTSQREKLIASLRDTSFVMTVDAGDNSKWASRPAETYISTARLKELLAGTKGIFVVDDEYDCLRGEEIRNLLEACGASRSLQPIPVEPDFTWEQRHELRIKGGCESSSGGERFIDYSFRGLDQLINGQKSLDHSSGIRKAFLLWEALSEVQERRGAGVFEGTYQWSYHHLRSARFDAQFIRQLNTERWIPDANGELQRPCDLIFDSLGWKPYPFLLSKIQFKPAIIEMLAKEAGIDLGVLDLLRKLGVTSEADLRARLRLSAVETSDLEKTDIPSPSDEEINVDVKNNAVRGEYPTAAGDSVPEQNTASDKNLFTDPEDAERERQASRSNDNADPAAPEEGREAKRATDTKPQGHQTRTREGEGGRRFISYIASHSEEHDGPDPDGLSQQARMDLEESALSLVLSSDPRLERTPANNPGFDLFEASSSGQPMRWVEVKAMSGDLTDRPVCLSRAQFDCAWTHGESFWLYIVEQAGDGELARILRIQDPAGKGKYFAFDKGWRKIADMTSRVS